MKVINVAILVCIWIGPFVMAQVPDTGQQIIEMGFNANTYINGYMSDDGKGHFQYHSLFGATTPSLLVRSTSEPITWSSAEVPEDYNRKFIEFLWLASADAGGNTPEFFFYINKLKRFSFSHGEAKSWSLNGAEGSALSYYHVKSDQHGDTHGYMHLRIPTKWITPGQSVQFKLEGNGKGENAWLQVYRRDNICQYLYNKSTKEQWLNARLENNNLTLSTGSNLAMKDVEVIIGSQTYRTKLDASAQAQINLNSTHQNEKWQIILNNNYSYSGLQFNEAEDFFTLAEDGIVKHIKTATKDAAWTLTAKSVYQPQMVELVKELSSSSLSKGSICLMNSSHQDIAWMDDPEKCILERDTMLITPMIKDGLAKSEYSFDIEDALMIEEYLTRHPDQKANILQLINEGKISVGATYSQPYEEMYSGESLARQFYWGKHWLNQELNGYQADTYWNVDVPGRTLQMPQLMAKAGVPNLMISRQAKGVYYWKAPDGSKIRTYSSGHYSLDFSGLNRDFYDAAAHIAKSALFWKEGYNDIDPYEAVIPILSDWDMSPAKDYSELITKWHQIRFFENAQHKLIPITLPTIELTTANNFIERISKNSQSLKVIAGERPALWLYIHGPSHQKAIKASRAADRMLINAEKFSVFDALTRGSFAQYPEQELQNAWKNKIYPDHGWGGKNGDITDAIFEAKYQKALSSSRQITNNAISNIASRIKTRKQHIPVVLFNGLSWERQSPVQVNLNFDKDQMRAIRVEDSNGNPISIQITKETLYPSGSLKSISFEMVANVPSLGYSTYYVVPAIQKQTTRSDKLDNTIETPFFQIELGHGGLQSIIDKESGQELINSDSFLAGDIFTLQSEGNGAGEFVQVQQPTLKNFDRVSDHHPEWELLSDGEVFSEFRLRQAIKHADAELKVKIYKQIPRIDFDAAILNWEGVLYREFRMAFPLHESLQNVAYEVPYGILHVGEDEMKGPAGGEAGGLNYSTPCQEIHPRGIMNWIGASNKDVSLVISSSVVAADYIDLLDRNKTNLQPILLASRQSCHWEGNPYLQTGDHHFKFSLSSTTEGLNTANQIGISNNEPIMVVVNPQQVKKAKLKEELSFVNMVDKDVIISAIKKAEQSDDVIVRLYNTSNEDKEIVIECNWEVRSVTKTNLIEEAIESVSTHKQTLPLQLGKYAIETFKLEL